MKKIKRFFKRKTKTGASLLIVLISVTMLIIMGTGFAVIAMSGYNNSHRRLCQQQAYYTAEACLTILSNEFSKDTTGQKMEAVRTKLRNELHRQKSDVTIPEQVRDKLKQTDVVVELASLVDNGGVVSIPTNSIEASLSGLMGDCKVQAQAYDGDISQIRLTATATYKGYSQSISARMACTNKGSLELSKIFSNSQCWDTPIVTLIAGETTGDMYFASPGEYLRHPNGEIRSDAATIESAMTAEEYANIPAELKGKTVKEYNNYIRKNIYGNIPTGNSANTGQVAHTKPFDIYNKPLRSIETRAFNEKKQAEWQDKTFKFKYGWFVDYDERARLRNEYLNSLRQPVYDYFNAGIPADDMAYMNLYNNAYCWHKDGREDWGCPNDAKVWTNTNGDPVGFYTKCYNGGGLEGYNEDNYFKKDIELGPTNVWYNDWVEIYMYTGDQYDKNDADSIDNFKNIVDGDMYVNTKALIGLFDRNADQVQYWHYYDTYSDVTKIKRLHVNYAGSAYRFDNSLLPNDYEYRYKYKNGADLTKNFEHGTDGDLFFNYSDPTSTPPAYNASALGHNGNMYLFENARIEAYDSIHTPNAYNGVKNNIYAHGNLCIDGFVSSAVGTAYVSDDIPSSRNVHIYGDVMCEKNLQISNAVIYGDVYCNGRELNISDSFIFGNIYYAGKKCKMDNTKVLNGAFNVPLFGADGKVKTDGKGNVKTKDIPMRGGDVVVMGKSPLMPEDAAKLTNIEVRTKSTDSSDEANKLTENKSYWGAVFTNCSMDGNLVSMVNTKIRTASMRDGKELSLIDNSPRFKRDAYHNIFISGIVTFDCRDRYLYDGRLTDTGSQYESSKTGAREMNKFIAFSNNKLYVDGSVFAEQAILMQVQNNDIKNAVMPRLPSDDKIFLYGDRRDNCQTNMQINTIYVGQGGIIADGNSLYCQKDIRRDYKWDAVYDANGKTIPCWRAKEGSTWIKGIGIKKVYNGSGIVRMWDISAGPDAASLKNYDMKYPAESDYGGYNDLITGTTYDEMDYYSITGEMPAKATNHSMKATKLSAAALDKIALDALKDLFKEQKEMHINPDGSTTIVENRYKMTEEEETNITTIATMAEAMCKYMTTYRMKNRVNNYYKYLTYNKDFKGFKPIEDIANWATADATMYPVYDKDNPTGVWRTINVLNWDAPADKAVEPDNDRAVEYNELKADPISKKVILQENEFIKRQDTGVYVIEESFKTTGKLYVGDNQTLIFDTHNGNIHAKLLGGIELGKDAKVILTGGAMTFLYLIPTATSKTLDVNTELFTLGEGARMGIVQGKEDANIDIMKRDSIYIIAKDLTKLTFNQSASLYGYLYAPNGYMCVNTTKGTAPYTILRGSMLIKSFYMTLTDTYQDVVDKFANLKYEYIRAPLIIDSHIDYGTTDGEKDEYNDPNWGFVGFE